MATSTGPDLSAGKAAVEALMDDTCTITRYDSNRAGTTDPVTFEVTSPSLTIYDGPCLVSGALTDRQSLEGGITRAETEYELKVPIEAPELRAGDHVRITSSRRDARLPAEEFEIREVLYKTMAITRKARMVRREEVF